MRASWRICVSMEILKVRFAITDGSHLPINHERKRNEKLIISLWSISIAHLSITVNKRCCLIFKFIFELLALWEESVFYGMHAFMIRTFRDNSTKETWYLVKYFSNKIFSLTWCSVHDISSYCVSISRKTFIRCSCKYRSNMAIGEWTQL